MTDGFKMRLPSGRDYSNEWKRKQNEKDLRESTRKYCSLAPEQRIALAIGSKEGAVANVMRDEQGATCILSLVKRKGGYVSVPAHIIQSCFDRGVPLRCYLEGISKNIEWRIYEFIPDDIILDEESHTEDQRTWFRLQLGTAWRID